ncbi:MAG: GNAT family N-acetyltransferase [Bacteroidales bacterium]|nr:GNAT family N-acetyltransferase [Bacteroidales bacterium]
MIELNNADNFITCYEKTHRIKIQRIPFTSSKDERKSILMCHIGKKWVSLPYLSIGVMETKPTDIDSAPFQIFESEEGNYISTSRQDWEIRDTVAHSQYIYSQKVFPTIKLNYENLWNCFSSNVKRKIRKAQKNGIEIIFGKDKSFVKRFHRVYSQRMAELGTFSFPKKAIQRRANAGYSIIFLALKDGIVIGGATLTDYMNGTFVNELFATSKDYNKYYTSYLLHYAMMCYAQENKAKYYSLGRCTKNSSLHKYKKHWQGEDITLFWSFSKKQRNIREYNFHKHLPKRLIRWASPWLSKWIY